MDSSTKRMRVALFALVTGVFLTHAAWAHHGWGWATDEEFELTGKITAVRLGNPHGEVTLDVKGEEWIVEVGQPWRNERGGAYAEAAQQGTTHYRAWSSLRSEREAVDEGRARGRQRQELQSLPGP